MRVERSRRAAAGAMVVASTLAMQAGDVRARGLDFDEATRACFPVGYGADSGGSERTSGTCP